MPDKQILFAPWRMAYIENSEKEESPCFLCRLDPAQPLAESLLIHKDERTLLLLNRYPYNPGHLLVAPVRHVALMGDLSPEEAMDLWKLQCKAVTLLEKAMSPQGFNLGINLGKVAGAGLPGHLHIHIVPRWNGDCNFMPVLGETKVIPQSLEETCRVLRTCWEESSSW